MPLTDKQKAHLKRITEISRTSRKHQKCKYTYIFGGKTYARYQLAELLGVTRERIRQLDNSGKLEKRVNDALKV